MISLLQAENNIACSNLKAICRNQYGWYIICKLDNKIVGERCAECKKKKYNFPLSLVKKECEADNG